MYSNAEAIIRPELSQIVQEASQADQYFIGQRVLPQVMVPTMIGQFPKFTTSKTESLKKQEMAERAPRTSYKRVDRTREMDSYVTRDRGLEEAIDDNDEADFARFASLEEMSSKMVLRQVQFGYEKRVADTIFDNAAFDAVAAKVAYTSVNLATIDPAQDLKDAVKRVKKRGEMPNTLVMNADMWDRMRLSEQLQKFLFGPLAGGKQITLQIMSEEFKLPQIIIAEAAWDTSAKGKEATPSYIWSADYMWIGDVQGGDFAAGGAGRTLVWTGVADSLFVVETYRDEAIRSDIVRVRQNTAEKLINPKSGTLVTTSYA